MKEYNRKKTEIEKPTPKKRVKVQKEKKFLIESKMAQIRESYIPEWIVEYRFSKESDRDKTYEKICRDFNGMRTALREYRKTNL